MSPFASSRSLPSYTTSELTQLSQVPPLPKTENFWSLSFPINSTSKKGKQDDENDEYCLKVDVEKEIENMLQLPLTSLIEKYKVCQQNLIQIDR